jgi:hypothetical protein
MRAILLTISRRFLEAPVRAKAHVRALSEGNQRNTKMELLLIIVVLMLLFGGGGYGYSRWRG